MTQASEATDAYQTLIQHLVEANYSFVCPSPETQARVVRKRSSDASTADAKTLEDFFGWSLPCSDEALRSMIPHELVQILSKASIITARDGGKLYSTIRVSDFYLPNLSASSSSDTPLYYIHSSFPASSDSVFFGPDTYLFVSFLQTVTRHVSQAPQSIVDMCCGSGAGAIHMARTYPQAKVAGLDLNPRALSLGNVNARLATTTVHFQESNLYASIPDDWKTTGIDFIVSNPPYIASSPSGRDLPIYADGGAEFGLDISLRIVEEGINLLSSIGMIVVYTGVAIPVAKPGHDAFLEKLRNVESADLIEYTILHPDMWPEEIGQGAYADVGRIQAVGAVLRKKG